MRYFSLLDRFLNRKYNRSEHLLNGFRSLGSLLDSRTVMEDYLKGNNVDDMRSDWVAVGNDLRSAMSAYNNSLYGRK